MENQNSVDLKALKEMLPHGSYKAIAEKTGYDKAYISTVLNGRIELTPDNIKIVEQAQKIAEKAKEKIASVTAGVNKFLSDNKA